MKKIYFVLTTILFSLTYSYECFAVNEKDIIFKSYVEGYQWDNYLTEHYKAKQILYNGNDLGEIYVIIYETNNTVTLEIVMASLYWETVKVFDKCTIVKNTNTYGGNRREFTLNGNYFEEMRVEINKETDTAQFKILGKNDGLLVLDTKIFYNNGKLFNL